MTTYDAAFFGSPELEERFRKWATQTTLAREEQGGILLCDQVVRRGRPGRNLPFREAMKVVGASQALVVRAIVPAVNNAVDRAHSFSPGDWGRLLDIGWSLQILGDGYKPVLFHTHPSDNGEPSPADWRWAADMARDPYHAWSFAVVGVAQPFDIRFYDMLKAPGKDGKGGKWIRVEFLSHRGSRYIDKAFETAYRKAANKMELSAAGVAV